MSDGTTTRDERWYEPRRPFPGRHIAITDTPVRVAYQEMWEALVRIGELSADDPMLLEAVLDGRAAVAAFVEAMDAFPRTAGTA